MDICLRDVMQGSCGWGRQEGLLVGEALEARIVSSQAELMIVRLSLARIEQTDVSFIRSALVEPARSFRGRLGFCLTDADDPDVLENWDAAALKYKQPLFAWKTDATYQLLGEQPSVGLRQALAYVLARPVARTCEMAVTLHLQGSNASNKLKALWQAGYILRRETNAGSGGMEYEYIRIA